MAVLQMLGRSSPEALPLSLRLSCGDAERPGVEHEAGAAVGAPDLEGVLDEREAGGVDPRAVRPVGGDADADGGPGWTASSACTKGSV